MTWGTARARAAAAMRKQDDDDAAGDGGEIAGGEGTAAFAGVLAVGIEVEKVVDDVGGRGAEAEADEGNDRAGDESGCPRAWASSRGRKMSTFFAH